MARKGLPFPPSPPFNARQRFPAINELGINQPDGRRCVSLEERKGPPLFRNAFPVLFRSLPLACTRIPAPRNGNSALGNRCQEASNRLAPVGN